MQPLTYPMHDDILLVNSRGAIQLPRERRVYVAIALAGHEVGVREEDDGSLSVAFGDIELGHFDAQTLCFVPKASPPPEAA